MPLAARSFTCATNRNAGRSELRAGGPRRWVQVRIYDSVDDLRTAAARLDPHTHPQFWSDCVGVFQPPRDPSPANGFVGTLRLARPIDSEVMVHELVHAAAAVVRSWTTTRGQAFWLGGNREEQLAYAYGDLYAHFHHQI